MKTSIEKHKFGMLLEDDIANAIKETKLNKYTMTNVVIKTSDTWRQIDILIILPHKVVTIEAKNSTAEEYQVYKNKDILVYNGKESDYGNSIVTQTTKTKTILTGIFANLKGKKTFSIETVGCIRAENIVNYQNELPIHSDKTIWYYIKSLESEMESYNQLLVENLYEDKLKVLKPFLRKPETYERYLRQQGKYNNEMMLVETKLVENKELKLVESDGKIHSNYKKRQEFDKRVNRISQSIKNEEGITYDWLHDYVKTYEKESDWSIIEFVLGIHELMIQNIPILQIINKNGHYVNNIYIVDYCKTKNIFFNEFLYECVEYLKNSDVDYYEKLLNGVTLDPPKDLNFKRVIGGILNVNMTELK